MIFHAGQHVEVFTGGGAATGFKAVWRRAVLFKSDLRGWDWGARYPDGEVRYVTNRWVRPLPALIQLAEAAE
jgi:hypothetical protein